MPVVHKEGITFPQIKAHRDFKNNIVIIQVSDPRELKEDTGVKFWKLILEEEGKDVQIFQISSQVKIFKIYFQVRHQFPEGIMNGFIV